MWQGAWFVVLLFSCGSVAQTLIQPQASITQPVGKTALIECQMRGDNISSTKPLHWYQQKPGKPLQRILYYGNSVTRDSEFGTSFNAVKTKSSVIYLRVVVSTDSAATYYCAFWVTSGTWKKIFGGGTRLFVTDQKVQPPTIHLFPPDHEEKEKDKFFVACLMTNFFPEVIEVQWDVPGNANPKILTEPVKKEKDNTYSLISRLEVSKEEWEQKDITCKVTHEAISTGEKVSSKSADKSATSKTDNWVGGTCPSTDEELEKTPDEETSYASLRVATLTYTALLTKSVLYCCIISFVVYRMESRAAKKSM